MKHIINRLLRDDSGAVAMEKVMLGVLIAVACLVAVIVLSRAMVRSTDVSSKAVVGKVERVEVAAKTYKEDTARESIIAKLYHLFITGED